MPMNRKLRIKVFLLNLIRFFSGKKIIVSLTSYPARYEALHLVVESLLRQKLKPDRVILYLYEGEAKHLPETLMRLKSKRFCIVTVGENIRPHKKYFYAFQNYPKDLIITVDDDYIYPSDLVMNLYRKHLSHRNAVIGGRCREIKVDEQGKLLPYNLWPICHDDSRADMSLVATGVGGVLYTPALLDARVLDLEGIKELALNQDDLWLKTMEILKGTRTVPVTLNWAEGKALTYDGSLFSTNEYGENDACFQRLMQHYQVSTQMIVQ